jgi:hypothetical protein
VPHWALFVFFLLPWISLLCTGAVKGLGSVIPEVSDSAVTSIAEGGAMIVLILLWILSRID